MTDIKVLAELARPINDDDWGSERQIEAENLFFNTAVRMGLDGDVFVFENLKATTNELIDEVLKRIGA